MQLTGGLGERYCSQSCYDRGGATVTKHLLSGWQGDCSVCRAPVALRMGGAASMVCWKPGQFLFHCGSASCVAAVKDALRGYPNCAVCGTTPVTEPSKPPVPVVLAGVDAITAAFGPPSTSLDSTIRVLEDRGRDPFLVAGGQASFCSEQEAIRKLGVLLELEPSWITRKSDTGATLLFKAVANDWKDLARYLVEKGSDVHAATQNGNTPLKVAKDRNRTELIALLDGTTAGRAEPQPDKPAPAKAGVEASAQSKSGCAGAVLLFLLTSACVAA